MASIADSAPDVYGCLYGGLAVGNDAGGDRWSRHQHCHRVVRALSLVGHGGNVSRHRGVWFAVWGIGTLHGWYRADDRSNQRARFSPPHSHVHPQWRLLSARNVADSLELDRDGVAAGGGDRPDSLADGITDLVANSTGVVGGTDRDRDLARLGANSPQTLWLNANGLARSGIPYVYSLPRSAMVDEEWRKHLLTE